MIKDKLKEIREKTGMNKKDFANHIGVKYTTYNGYETGAREPDSEFLILISKKFDVSIDYILGLQNEREVLHAYQLKATEYEHIQKYRALDDYGKESVNITLNREMKRIQDIAYRDARITELEDTLQQYPSVVRMYTYLNRIASAGKGFYFDDIPTDQIEAPYLEGADFIVGVNGDSMEPEYYDGDKVYVRKCLDLLVGEIGIFTLDGECYIKEWGGDRLISYNDDYDDILLSDDSNIRCIGRVIGKLDEEEEE